MVAEVMPAPLGACRLLWAHKACSQQAEARGQGVLELLGLPPSLG